VRSNQPGLGRVDCSGHVGKRRDDQLSVLHKDAHAGVGFESCVFEPFAFEAHARNGGSALTYRDVGRFAGERACRDVRE
jgi:hypothetical protein